MVLVSLTHASCDVYGEPKVFITWAPWQVDSVLAAWALQRYVFFGAGFEAVQAGTDLPNDVALDTPNSKYRRNGSRTAFEEVLRTHSLKVPCTEYLRPLNRVLELTKWRKSEYPEAEAFESKLAELYPMKPGKGGLEAAFHHLDEICEAKSRK